MDGIKRILQVEDSEEVIGLVAIALEGDAKIDVATNFGAAVAAIEGRNGYIGGLSAYYALLLDMSFPGGNGIDVARLAAERGFGGRIVLFTGSDMRSIKESTKMLAEQGANIGYLQKPAKRVNLLNALDGTYSD